MEKTTDSPVELINLVWFNGTSTIVGYLMPNPFLSAWAGYDTRSTFKQSLTGLNSEFSFS